MVNQHIKNRAAWKRQQAHKRKLIIEARRLENKKEEFRKDPLKKINEIIKNAATCVQPFMEYLGDVVKKANESLYQLGVFACNILGIKSPEPLKRIVKSDDCINPYFKGIIIQKDVLWGTKQ